MALSQVNIQHSLQLCPGLCQYSWSCESDGRISECLVEEKVKGSEKVVEIKCSASASNVKKFKKNYAPTLTLDTIGKYAAFSVTKEIVFIRIYSTGFHFPQSWLCKMIPLDVQLQSAGIHTNLKSRGQVPRLKRIPTVGLIDQSSNSLETESSRARLPLKS